MYVRTCVCVCSTLTPGACVSYVGMGLCIQSSLICIIAGEPVLDVRIVFYVLLFSSGTCIKECLQIKSQTTYYSIVRICVLLLGVFAYRNDVIYAHTAAPLIS